MKFALLFFLFVPRVVSAAPFEFTFYGKQGCTTSENLTFLMNEMQEALDYYEGKPGAEPITWPSNLGAAKAALARQKEVLDRCGYVAAVKEGKWVLEAKEKAADNTIPEVFLKRAYQECLSFAKGNSPILAQWKSVLGAIDLLNSGGRDNICTASQLQEELAKSSEALDYDPRLLEEFYFYLSAAPTADPFASDFAEKFCNWLQPFLVEEVGLAALTIPLNFRQEDEFNSVGKRAVEFTKKYGISNAEASAIQFYTSAGYVGVNRALRSRDAAELRYYRAAINVINRGLKKIPPKVTMVSRGAELPGAILDQHKPGTIVTYDAYTSTALSFGFPGNAQFIIYSKKGKHISDLSTIPDENEVLFAPGAKFKILSRTDFFDGESTFIVMEEVE